MPNQLEQDFHGSRAMFWGEVIGYAFEEFSSAKKRGKGKVMISYTKKITLI